LALIAWRWARGVVVDVPAFAFEVEGRRGQRALKHASAFGTDKFRLGIEVLNFFELMAALGAAIGV
jgi:hypothetical protein